MAAASGQGREMLTKGSPLYRQILRVHPLERVARRSRPVTASGWVGRPGTTRGRFTKFARGCLHLNFQCAQRFPSRTQSRSNRVPSLRATNCSANGNDWPRKSTRRLSLHVMGLETTCLDWAISPIVHGILVSSNERTREKNDNAPFCNAQSEPLCMRYFGLLRAACGSRWQGWSCVLV